MNYKINNHLKITLTKKATGESVVLYDDTKLQNGFDGVNYTSRPQGRDGKLSAAPPFVESVDDQFFSAVLVLNESTQSLYDIFDPVKVEITSNGETTTQHYLVGGNGTALQDARNTTCEKTINLVEPTKILTRYPIFNLNLTSKKDTLLRQFEKALNNSVLLLDDDECPFALSEELTEMLTGLTSEDFFFSDTNLYAVLMEMLSVIDCRPFVKKVEIDSLTKNFKTIVIDALKMSETHDAVFTPSTDQTKPEENHGVYISQELSNDGNDYMGKIVARGYNSISNNPIVVTDAFKSDEDTLSIENAFAFLPFPIERINKFIFSGQYSAQYSIKTSTGDSIAQIATIKGEVDISRNLLLDEEYNVLSATEKQAYLPYAIGEQSIGFSAKRKVVLQTQYNIDKILTQHGVDLVSAAFPNAEIVGVSSISVLDIGKCYFICDYVPRLSTTLETTKPSVYDIDRLRLGIQDTQSANTIDIVRHGKNIEGLVRRTGNDEITVDMMVQGHHQLYPLMTRFVGGAFDDYVIWQREYSVASQNIKVRYSLTKGFNRVATKLGVKRERHIFSIPTASEDCPLLIKHYAVFSTKTPTDSSVKSFLNVNIYNKEFANNLVAKVSRESASPLENITFATPEAYVVQEEGKTATLDALSEERFVLPCLGYSAGKTITFAAQPLDNFSAGFRVGKKVKFNLWGGGGTKILYAPYCDINGESKNFTVSLCGALNTIADDFDVLVNKLPVLDAGNFIQMTASQSIDVNYKKDRTQRPVFTFAIECIPGKDDYGNIVIGDMFAQTNFLLPRNKGITDEAYLYLSSDLYRDGDTKCKGSRVALSSEIFSIANYNHPTYVALKMTGDGVESVANQNHNSWAIGDVNKNIYVAVNQSLPLTEGETALTIQFRRPHELGR